MQNGAATLEDNLAVSLKAKHTFTIQPRFFAPWYLLRLIENLCIWMFIAASLIIAKIGKQPRCLSVAEWLN